VTSVVTSFSRRCRLLLLLLLVVKLWTFDALKLIVVDAVTQSAVVFTL